MSKCKLRFLHLSHFRFAAISGAVQTLACTHPYASYIFELICHITELKKPIVQNILKPHTNYVINSLNLNEVVLTWIGWSGRVSWHHQAVGR